MKQYTAHLQSLTPYAQGRFHDLPKLEREQPQAYDLRTYLSRLHTSVGKIFIPPLAFKKCIEETAQYLRMQIPGQGKATYTKNFKRGVLCNEPFFPMRAATEQEVEQGATEGSLVRIAPADTRLEKIFTSLTPGKMNSPRGWRHFPVIDQWEGLLHIIVIDELITEAILKRHLELGGQITGVGVWRPSSPNGGLWGKFKVVSMEEQEI